MRRYALCGAECNAGVECAATAQVIRAAGGRLRRQPQRRILSLARNPSIPECQGGVSDMGRPVGEIERDGAVMNVADAELISRNLGPDAARQAEDVVPTFDEGVERPRADVADR